MPEKSATSDFDRVTAILVNPRVVSAMWGAITMVTLYLINGLITKAW